MGKSVFLEFESGACRGLCFYAPHGRFVLEGKVAYIGIPDIDGWVSFPNVQQGQYRLRAVDAALPADLHCVNVSDEKISVSRHAISDKLARH